MSKSQMRKEAEKTEGKDICAEKEGKKDRERKDIMTRERLKSKH